MKRGARTGMRFIEDAISPNLRQLITKGKVIKMLTSEERHCYYTEISRLEKILNDDAKEKEKNQLEQHKEYLGKTYKCICRNTTHYFKVVSLDEKNIYRANCIVFSNELVDHVNHNVMGAQSIVGIDSVGLWCHHWPEKDIRYHTITLLDLVEISGEEYTKALAETIEKNCNNII